MKRFALLVLSFSMAWTPVPAQDQSLPYQMTVSSQGLRIEGNASIQTVLKWSEDGKFDKASPPGIANRNFEYWFEVDFSDHFQLIHQYDSLIFYPGLVEISELFVERSGVPIALVLTSMVPNDVKRSAFQNQNYIPISTAELFDGRKLYIKSRYLRATPYLNKKTFAFSTPEAHRQMEEFISQDSFKSQVLAFFFLGVAAVLMVFNLILFFNVKQVQFIYYGAFLLFQLIYYSRISPYLADYFGYADFRFYFLLTTASQILINLSYLLFIRHFLDIDKVLPGFDKIIRWVGLVLVAFILINLGLIIHNPYSYLQSVIMDIQRYFMAGFAFFGIGYLWIHYPGRLKYFVIAGTLIFTSGALLTMFFLKLTYMVTGAAIESTIFALGLSYKIKLINEEKQLAEKETFSTRLTALRAQINPHFIFNSLSSIQHLISSGQKDAALSYLAKFSKFVRQVLENSIDIHVTLEKEIELLRVYLDLESLRFDHAFSYEICLPQHGDLIYQEVPMLIVQPFVENALKHGLMPKTDGDRKVWIRFIDQEDHILCEVEDNGIGRIAAEARKSASYRPSRGLALTEERLKMFKETQKPHIRIEDLPTGTKVSILLPKL